MTECDHRWIDDGEGRSRVRCVRCGAYGNVVVMEPQPAHLKWAREDHNAALILARGSTLHIAHLEGAIGHLICYLEGKD